jgi:UDP-N-acetylglucosamine:LPS N-acetylglucosamine transferase
VRLQVGLICSSGGHLTQLLALRPWWEKHDRFWVCFDTPDARDRLAGERVWHAWHPTNRNPANLLRNLRLALRVLAAEEPDLLVSDGAGVALPFFALGRAAGVPLVWLEVYDRVDRPSLTGRLVRPWADLVVLQWEEQRAAYPEGVVVGPLL